MYRQRITLVVLATLHFAVAGEKKDPPRKIAVIGGGIGGTSASYFLRQQFGSGLEIDLFEPSTTMGGRVATVEFAGREYECGASIAHPKNLYLRNFVHKFGLQTANGHKGTLGFFDGKDYLLRTSPWSIITFIKMLWMFGFDLLRLNWLEDRFLDEFEKIYDLQEEGQSYDDVSSLLHAMGGDEFIQSTHITAQKLFKMQGISNFTIDNLIYPGIRVNYGQNTSVTGFVGTVAMAGVQSGLWSVKGGNKLICDKLVSSSSANIIHERVSSVMFQPKAKDGKFSILTEQSPDTTRHYDIVILAAPLILNANNIDLTKACSDMSVCPTADQTEDGDSMEFRTTVANFVRGKLSSRLFQCDTMEDCPSAIFVPNHETFYRSIGLLVPVDYDPEVDKLDSVYKVFSSLPLTKGQLSHLFESYTDIATVDWKAYPYYHAPEKLKSMVLNPEGLYYTSPIEWAASAMEMSIISARNSVLLAFNNWFGIEANMNSLQNDEKVKSKNSEL